MRHEFAFGGARVFLAPRGSHRPRGALSEAVQNGISLPPPFTGQLMALE